MPSTSIPLSDPGQGEDFVVINVSESVSKAFIISSVASNGGLAHRERSGPSFISLAGRKNWPAGVGLQASHTPTHILPSCGT